MIKNNLNLQEIFSEAWIKTKGNIWFLFCLFVVSAIVVGATNHIPFLSFIVSVPVGIAMLTVAIIIAEGHKPKYEDLFKSFDDYKITLNYFIASIIYMVVIIAGFIFFIIPGVYLAIRLQFYKFLVIENKNKSPTEILKESYKITEGHFWELLGFMFVIIVMNLIGSIPFGLGLIVTIPLTVVASAVLYKRVSNHNITHHQAHAQVI